MIKSAFNNNNNYTTGFHSKNFEEIAASYTLKCSKVDETNRVRWLISKKMLDDNSRLKEISENKSIKGKEIKIQTTSDILEYMGLNSTSINKKAEWDEILPKLKETNSLIIEIDDIEEKKDEVSSK